MTVVVAVHGNGGGSTRFDRVPALLPAGTVLHPVDLPGFGGVALDPGLDSVAAFADRLGEEVAEVATRLGPPVLLGHGIGGSIALDLASRRPGLLGGLILHAPVGADLDTRLFPRLMATPTVREAMRRLVAARPLRPLWSRLFFPMGAPASHLDRFFEGYRSCEAFGLMFELLDADWFDGLAPVTDVPTVLLWGERDRVLDARQVEAFRARCPGARVVVEPGWDHFPMLEQPAAYAAVVARLAGELTDRSADGHPAG